MLAAVLIDISREPEAATWVPEIISSLTKYNLSTLHFKHCNVTNGRIVCGKIAGLPVRCFVVASNKKNMRGHSNPFAAQIPSKNWFYCWITRLLLERVTYFAEQKSIEIYGEPRPLRIELSERGRFSYPQLMAYYEWLKFKSTGGANFLALGDLSWSVMHRDLIEIHPNETRPGLQLADAVASSFFRASDIEQVAKHDPKCAELLEPRIARDPDKVDGRLHGFGVKLMPNLGRAKLTCEQQRFTAFTATPMNSGGCRKKSGTLAPLIERLIARHQMAMHPIQRHETSPQPE